MSLNFLVPQAERNELEKTTFSADFLVANLLLLQETADVCQQRAQIMVSQQSREQWCINVLFCQQRAQTMVSHQSREQQFINAVFKVCL